jgi:hypothetical protein
MFFATESLTGGTVFTTPIDSHLHTQPWSRVAELLVSHRLEAMHTAHRDGGLPPCWRQSSAQRVLFTAAVASIVLGYRFVLLVITLYTT